MGVVVYSRLGDVLRARNLSVDDLQRHIAAHFDLATDTRTIDRLTRGERVHWPDMETAAAVAAALDVGLDDILIFLVDVMPMGDEGEIDTHKTDNKEDDILAPGQSQRLSDLFDLRGRRSLTDDERAELDALVAVWGRTVSEREFRELAERQGVPVEQVRAEALADVDRALTWWREVQADPARLKTVVRAARDRQQARIAASSRPTAP